MASMLCRRLVLSSTRTGPAVSRRYIATDDQKAIVWPDEKPGDEDFRVLDTVWPKTDDGRRQRSIPSFKKNLPSARYKRMSTEQHWMSVWPTAKMFNPAVVPLPVHMGHIKRTNTKASAPDKWANAELMKIPNFLHLSPPAIAAHCQVLKQFCTPWPKELTDDEQCNKHFPMEYVFSDFVHAAPTIRDVRARVVKLQFKLSRLPLDYRSKDKMIRILNGKEKRYNEKTDIVTIVADRCPMKIQNYDYINYLITACFFESHKMETWEEEKEMTDWEHFYFEKSPSFKTLAQYLQRVENSESLDVQELLQRDEVNAFGTAVTKLFDVGESEETLEEYKKSVLKLMFAKTGSAVVSPGGKDDPSPDRR